MYHVFISCKRLFIKSKCVIAVYVVTIYMYHVFISCKRLFIKSKCVIAVYVVTIYMYHVFITITNTTMLSVKMCTHRMGHLLDKQLLFQVTHLIFSLYSICILHMRYSWVNKVLLLLFVQQSFKQVVIFLA